MNNFTHLMSGYNVGPLLKELGQNGEESWREDTYLRTFPQGPFGDTDSIILRFPPRAVPKTQEEVNEFLATHDQHENIWQPIAEKFPEFKKVIFELAYRTGSTRIGRCMINRIRDKGTIFPHADTPAHALYWTRHHIVVGALPGCSFRCGDETTEWKTGDVFWFRNEFEHEVTNNSGAPRIHLVVDLKIESIK